MLSRAGRRGKEREREKIKRQRHRNTETDKGDIERKEEEEKGQKKGTELQIKHLLFEAIITSSTKTKGQLSLLLLPLVSCGWVL